MIVALTIGLNQQLLGRVTSELADRAMVIPAMVGAAADTAQRLPVSIVIMDVEPLTTGKLLDYRQLRDAHDPVTLCIGPEDAREQIRSDGLFTPDLWLAPDASAAEVAQALEQAMARAQLNQPQAPAPPLSLAAQPPPSAPPRAELAASDNVWRILVSAMAADSGADRLLDAYVEAAVQMAHCASYCLLWEHPQGGLLTVRSSQGLPAELVSHGRLAASDALARWYRHNSRALTRQELARWPDVQQSQLIAQEMAIFRGEVVIPLLPGGRLQGLLVLGAKIFGEPYAPAELEALFALGGYVTLRLENIQLQEQVRHTQAHLERSLASMRCGIITLGPDQRIQFCNPFAGQLLGLSHSDLEGADVRALPSPIGDYLYSACQSPEAAVVGERVHLVQRRQHLRVTTSTLFDEHGHTAGAVLLLEDVSGAIEDASAAARQETVHALTRIIGRIAHEVRTPLTAIKTYAELMCQPDDQDELARFWRDTVSPELDRLDKLINEQVRLVEQPEPQYQLVRLEEIVQKVVSTAAEEHVAAPPALKVVPPVPRVVADPGPTQDAFSYLMRYLYDKGASGVGVVVEEKKGPIAKVRVRMRVRANGERPEAAEILDPLTVLQREDGDLGPAIGKQLVDRQGGMVEVGHGEDYFEFRVTFPVNHDAPTGQRERQT